MNQERSSVFLRLPVVVAALLLLLGAGAAVGEETAAATADETAAQAEIDWMPVAIAGMQVAVDPATGKLRPPTPAEARQLAASLLPQLGMRRGPLRTVAHRDGMLSAVLTTDYLSFTVAAVGAEGTPVATCVDHPAEAAAALAPALGQLEEE